MQTPFWKFCSLCGLRAPKAGKAHLSPLKVFCPSSELNWKYLPGFTDTDITLWFMYFRNPGSHKPWSLPMAALCSEWSRHRLACLASPYTCTLRVQCWPCLWAGTAERGVSVPGPAPPWVERAMRMRGVGAGGRRVEGRAGATVQLLQQVWLVLGAQRQLCFSSDSR